MSDGLDGREPGGSAERQSDGPAAFMRALRVPRNAKWGLAAAVAITAVVYYRYVFVPDTPRSELWYLSLAFVLALSLAGLIAFLLTLATAYRLSRDL